MIHIDTYGTVNKVFIDVIKPLVHLYRTSTCSNRRQPTKWKNLYAKSTIDATNNVNNDWAIKDAAVHQL
uniref:Uncharacterized protein n=1 Tax=Romanomermis culicivorax TaxID=13658 RepID=A0A915I0K0_ROMCU